MSIKSGQKYKEKLQRCIDNLQIRKYNARYHRLHQSSQKNFKNYIRKGRNMNEAETLLFQDVRSCLQEIKDFLKYNKKESVDDLKFLKVPIVAKILGKSPKDTRELMRKPDFPSVPDEQGDLKVEEQKFISWCRAEHINID